jgi:hypothetical protein
VKFKEKNGIDSAHFNLETNWDKVLLIMQQRHTQKVNLDPQPKDLLPRNITNKHEVTFTVLIREHVFRAVQEIELPVTGGRNPPRLQTSSGATLYAARLPCKYHGE